MNKTNKYSPEVKERAVRLVQEHRNEYSLLWATIESIAPKCLQLIVKCLLNYWCNCSHIDASC